METKTKPKGLNKHYKVTTIRDGQMVEQVMTRQQRDHLDPHDVDIQIDEPRQEISIKHKNSLETTLCGPRDMRGIGAKELKLLVEVVFSAGDIVQLERKDCRVHQRVRRLRRLFRDSKDEQFFLVTTTVPNYGIAINTARSWRFIEALAE